LQQRLATKDAKTVATKTPYHRKVAGVEAVEAMYKEPNPSVKLDSEDLALVKHLAARERVTKSELVRRVIRKVAREAGLLPPKDASVL
jgi:hypothetical protein